MSETDISRAIRATLTRAGYHVERVNSGKVPTRGGWYAGAEPGTPDTVVVSPVSAYGWLETKTDEGELNENQRRWHVKARRRGVRIAVVRSPREALAAVQGWERGSGVSVGPKGERRFF